MVSYLIVAEDELPVKINQQHKNQGNTTGVVSLGKYIECLQFKMFFFFNDFTREIVQSIGCS